MVAFFEFAAKITRTGKSCFFRYGGDGFFCCGKQSGSTGEAILDQAKCGTRQYSNKFHFMMPVPVDAVKIKRPDIFVVIRKRKALVSMRNGFVKIFIGYTTGSGSNIYIHGITSKNSLFWDIVP